MNGCRQAEKKCFSVVFYRRNSVNPDWKDPSDWTAVDLTLKALCEELKTFKVALRVEEDAENTIDIKGYGDILNSVRLRYPAGGFTNTCLGHVIGQSSQRDLAADIRRGVNRILFAPEMIEPQGSDKIVCHNCGCGC